MPHGEQRLLAIARALAARPLFLLLDEPAAGLDEGESDELVGALAAIRDAFNMGLLVIEHDMRLIMKLAENIQVLDDGKTIALGTPAEIRTDPAVLSAYLGARKSMLRVRDLTVRYGSTPAVQHLDLEVEEGEIVGLVGSNGAGKSTTLAAIIGSFRSPAATSSTSAHRLPDSGPKTSPDAASPS